MIRKIGQDDSITKRITCLQCGSVLEYQPQDVQLEALYSGNEYSCTIKWIECPECKHRVVIQ